MIKEIVVLYAAAVLTGYLVLRALIHKKSIAPNIHDALWNAFFINLVLWKLSYSVFHPINEAVHPKNQLFFNGGTQGFLLGCAVVYIYLYWRSKREAILMCRFLNPGMVSFLSGFFIYHILIFILSQSNLYITLIQLCLALALILYGIVKMRTENPTPVWTFLLMWFSLGKILVSLFKHPSTGALGFSFDQWLFILLSLAVIVFSYFKRKFNPVIPIVILAGLMAWGLNQHFSSDHPQPGSVQGHASQREKQTGLKNGDLAPNFTLKNLHGKTVSLKDYRGKIVILNFWATWCPPCNAELPEVENYYSHHHNEKVVILGINLTSTETSANHVRSFTKQKGVTYPIALDLNKKVKQLYKVGAYPTSYFIDRKGVIQYKFVGAMNKQVIQKQVTKIKNKG